MKLDERGLYPIYDIWHVPFWQTKIFYIVIGITVAIFVGITAWRVIRRVRRKKLVPLSSWDRALRTFEQLQQRPCITREDGKEMYSILIRELKHYCADRYHYVCATKTDHEFLHAMHTQVSLEAIEALEDIVQGGILVKFANEQMIQDQLTKHIAYAIRVIHMTMPQQPTS